MTGNQYQILAARTINKELDFIDVLHHSLFGMAAEVGEVHSVFQKLYQGHEINSEELQKELGDVLWMIAELCTIMSWSLEDVMKLNIEKLKARYPDGFSTDKSLNRKDGDI